jgi:hypothetical protein
VPVPGDISLMRVWQDRDGYLVVEVGGERYRRLFDIRDGEVGRRVLDVIDRLIAFSKGKETRAAPLPPSEPLRDASEGTAPTPAAVQRPSDTLAGERSQEFLEQLQDQTPVGRRPSRVTLDPLPFRPRSAGKERSITLNLADEIDQLVQLRVKASPELSQRLIHVANAPDGGLRFEVDGARFAGLDEIPDPAVKAVIRAAIDEWEMRR